ncbi:TniQ family protein [Aliarcobacter lanthieri]|uniref:TniQ family protein n=1 Tax=Aliarcobacter lanthieri TaxID=1355374 RepID=UPI00047EF49D|nr:TniQ family protein [Aliarcobacter lanthieri]QKF58405.1 transposition-related protein TniQ [Aliarcobacter lanthieri]
MITKNLKPGNLKNKLFLIILKPLEDESFLSWFARTSYIHYTHPQTFLNTHFGLENRDILKRDLDVALSDKFIKIFTKKTKNKVDILSLTLKKYTGYLYEDEIMNANNKVFISNMKFCPICLGKDNIPYFRQYWKFIFITTCVKHNCYLYDACPKCNSKISIIKMYQDSKSYIYCHKCGLDLRKSKKQTIKANVIYGIKAQEKLMYILKKGYIRFKDKWLYPFVFFITIIQITKLIFLRKHTYFINQNPLFKMLKDKLAEHIKLSPPVFNRLNVQELFSLFGLIVYIFDNYPNNFRNFMKKNQLTYWDMVKEIKYLSFWYDNLVNDVSPRYLAFGDMITNEEIENAKKYLKKNDMDIIKANLQRLFGTYSYFFKLTSL